MPSFRFNSISGRFIAGTVCAAAVAFTSLTALVVYQVGNSLHRQQVELEAISELKLKRTLDAATRLAAARLEFLFDDTVRRVAAIATRADALPAIRSRNVVAISELLRPAAANAEVDGIAVVDRAGVVIGASSDTVDLIALRHELTATGLIERIKPLLDDNDPIRLRRLSQIMQAPKDGSFALTHHGDSTISHIVFAPLFDDFGDVSGGLIAQRWLRRREPSLVDFAASGEVGIAVLAGHRIISTAGLDNGAALTTETSADSIISRDRQHVLRCGEVIPPLAVCAFKPIQELYTTQNELTRIGKQEQQSLLYILILFGLGATGLSALTSVFISRQVTRPLTRITQVVSSVADGNYEERVAGIDRSDEVGNIARAVVVLQASARERDSLRLGIQAANKELKRQESELRTQNVLFDAALNNMSHGLCMFDVNQRLIVSNHRYCELFGLAPEQARPGISYPELIASQNIAMAPIEESASAGASRQSTVTYKLTNGSIILRTRQPMADGGWVAIYEDVTEREQARARLTYLARHDTLTELPNRLRMREHIETLLLRRDSEGGTCGLLYLDLDEFKTVNDTLGHALGDELLRKVAARLVGLATAQELVVRLGGDEFAIVTDTRTDSQQLRTLARLTIDEISKPYILGVHEVVISVSIGIAAVYKQAMNPDELIKQADLALYEAKAAGRRTYRFFEPQMEIVVRARHALIMDLRGAIKNGELAMLYQPQWSLASGAVTGFEALMRWRHRAMGMIPPAEFIPIAEETGLIVPMGEWALREACAAASQWPAPARIAVNISARQLQSKGFLTMLLNTLASTGLPPHRLELEVTETVLLNDDEATGLLLLHIKELGIKIALDDFGTGYSSLSCLRSFPFDKIKIDRSFVQTMADNADSGSIVHATIELAESLSISTTAEGVETLHLLELLRSSGCKDAQGYFLGGPASAEAACDLLLAQLPAFRPASEERTGDPNRLYRAAVG